MEDRSTPQAVAKGAAAALASGEGLLPLRRQAFLLSARADGRKKYKVWFQLMPKPACAAGEPVGHEFNLPTAKKRRCFLPTRGVEDRSTPPGKARAGAAVRPRGPSARAGMDYWGRMAVDCSMKSATQSSADISP